MSDADVEFWKTRMRKPQDSFYEFVRHFINSDEAKSWKQEKLFVPPGHFYSPIVNTKRAFEIIKSPMPQGNYPETLPDLPINKRNILQQWHELVPLMSTSKLPAERQINRSYYLDNKAFGWGDAYVYNALLRNKKPKRVVEIGSGYSSSCAIETMYNANHKCEFTFIDPHADLLRSLTDSYPDNFSIIEDDVQNVSLDLFAELNSGDILFIDSSHILKTASDVAFELFEILPILKTGVIVHFHDIFWPFEYPSYWIGDQNRFWNEIYALRAFLYKNKGWDVFFFNDYLAKVASDIILDTFPDFMKNPGGSIWMQKIAS